MMKFIGSKRVQEKVDLSRSTIWRDERKGRFPKRRQLSANRVAWVESEIDEWIESRAKVKQS